MNLVNPLFKQSEPAAITAPCVSKFHKYIVQRKSIEQRKHSAFISFFMLIYFIQTYSYIRPYTIFCHLLYIYTHRFFSSQFYFSHGSFLLRTAKGSILEWRFLESTVLLTHCSELSCWTNLGFTVGTPTPSGDSNPLTHRVGGNHTKSWTLKSSSWGIIEVASQDVNSFSLCNFLLLLLLAVSSCLPFD